MDAGCAGCDRVDHALLQVAFHLDPVSRGSVTLADDPVEIAVVGPNAAGRARLAMRLGYALVDVGWHPHQHRECVSRHEPASTPFCGPLPREAGLALQRCQELADGIANDPPPPGPNVPFVPWDRDDAGRYRLRFSSDERPTERSTTRTATLPDGQDADIWRAIVTEVASRYASGDRVGRSSGRVFLGPRKRFIFWPRDLNALLLHVPAEFGRLLDLFSVAAAMGVKLDIKAAYRALQLNPDDALFHAAIVDGLWVVFDRLSFGMAQSPVMFASTLAVTINRFRASLPATTAALAQWVDDSGIGGISTTTTLLAAESLMLAFRRDRWWLAIAKCWLWPAVRLSYTGFLVDFIARTVRIDPAKAAKALALLRTVTRPTDDAIARANPPPDSTPCPTSASTRRSVLTNAARSHQRPHPVAMGPLAANDLTDAVRGCHVLRAPGIPALPAEFAVGADRVYTSPAAGRNTIASCVADACRAGQPLLVLAPSVAEAASITSHMSHPATPVVPIAPAVPIAPHQPSWWDAAFRLPERFRSPGRVDPDALPSGSSAATPELPPQNGDRIALTGEEVHAIESAVGLLAWFGCALPFIHLWRAALAPLKQFARWTPVTATAFDTVFQILQVISGWSWSVDPPRSTLVIHTDASATGWGAAIVTDRGPPVYLSGILPAGATTASSGMREATGSVAAILQAIAHPDLPAFDSVRVVVDSTNVANAATSGHARASSLVHALLPIASWAAQGLRITFEWRSREALTQRAPDALSSAASAAAPWPLTPRVIDDIRHDTGPWAVDIAAYAGASSAQADAYATPAGDCPAERRVVLDGIAQGLNQPLPSADSASAAPPPRGWVGNTSSAWVPRDSAGFAWPLFSDLRTVCERWEHDPFRLILVAPRRSDATAREWWSPWLDRLTGYATMTAPLPDASSTPPVPGATRDPYPLAAYYIPGPADDPANFRGSSRLGTPARLAWVRGGRNPGDRPDDPPTGPADEARRRAARIASLFGGGPAPTDGGDPPPAAKKRAVAPPAPLPPRPTLSRPDPPSSHRPAAPNPPPMDDRPQSRAARIASLFGSANAHPSAAAAPTGPRTAAAHQPTDRLAGGDPAAGSHRPTASGAGASDTHPSTADALSRPGAVLRSVPATIGSWLLSLRDFIAGSVSGVVSAEVPEALHGDMAAARGVIRLKAIQGSTRVTRTINRLHRLACSLTGVLAAPFSIPAVDALATAYARRRLCKPPPFEWDACASAATPHSDLSSVAALSRRAGIPCPPVCGGTAAAYLDARGANGRRDHSDAWPLHLHDILSAEPQGPWPASGPSTAWWSWAALTVMSLLCLRTGILRHLVRDLLVPYEGGFVFSWRWVSKTSSGDVLDPELTSPVVRVAAARHPALTRIFAQMPARGSAFPGAAVTDAALTAFVRAHVSDVPDGFTVRTYGVRIAADCEAVEMSVPPDIVDALFWWRRTVASSRAYYSGVSVRRMMLFSEHRARLRFVHIRPGYYDVVLTGTTPLPNLSTVALSSTPIPALPPQTVADLDRAWGAEMTTVPTARIATARRNAAMALQGLGGSSAASAPQPAPPFIAEGDGDDEGESGDCDTCDTHLTRRDFGVLCTDIACHRMRCRSCHPSRRNWWCPDHAVASGAAARTKKRPPAKRG